MIDARDSSLHLAFSSNLTGAHLNSRTLRRSYGIGKPLNLKEIKE
ncbi:hypothetical protein [Tropheryma whipplei]|nr:hypothetical protein [Tropheryma whipplei]